MGHLENRLNKAKTGSMNEPHDISINTCVDFINTVNNNSKGISNSKVCIIGNTNGLLIVGVDILDCGLLVVHINDYPTNTFKINYRETSACSLILYGNKLPFRFETFDFILLVSGLNRGSGVEWEVLSSALSAAKLVFLLTKTDCVKSVIEKHSGSQVCGETIHEGRSKTSKGRSSPINCSILKIMK